MKTDMPTIRQEIEGIVVKVKGEEDKSFNDFTDENGQTFTDKLLDMFRAHKHEEEKGIV